MGVKTGLPRNLCPAGRSSPAMTRWLPRPLQALPPSSGLWTRSAAPCARLHGRQQLRAWALRPNAKVPRQGRQVLGRARAACPVGKARQVRRAALRGRISLSTARAFRCKAAPRGLLALRRAVAFRGASVWARPQHTPQPTRCSGPSTVTATTPGPGFLPSRSRPMALQGDPSHGRWSTPHAAPELRWEMPMANQSVRAKGCAARVKPDTGGQAPCDRVSPAAGRGLAVPPGPPAPNDGVAGLAWKVPSAKRKRPTRRQAPWNRQAIWGRCRRPEVFRPI